MSARPNHGFTLVSVTDEVAPLLITISIGRNVGDKPLGTAAWNAFRRDVESLLGWSTFTVHVNRAKSVGVWNSISEESATWVAEAFPQNLDAIRKQLATLAKRYQQDAIALTIGNGELIPAE